MKNKKLFAILTLVCFMMTLMPVAAFAATFNYQESYVYTSDENASEKVQVENGDANASEANLGIKFDFSGATTDSVFVWFVKDGSNVPVLAVAAPATQKGDTVSKDNETGIFHITGNITEGDEYLFAFANSGKYSVYASAEDPNSVNEKTLAAKIANVKKFPNMSNSNQRQFEITSSSDSDLYTVQIVDQAGLGIVGKTVILNAGTANQVTIDNAIANDGSATVGAGSNSSSDVNNHLVANGVASDDITFKLLDKNGKAVKGATVKLSTNSSRCIVNKETVTTDTLGQFKFTLTLTAEAPNTDNYTVYIDCGSYSGKLIVSSSGTGAHDIVFTKLPTAPISTDDVTKGADLSDYIWVQMRDVNDNVTMPYAMQSDGDYAEPAFARTYVYTGDDFKDHVMTRDYTSDKWGKSAENYVSIVSQPAASKLEDKDCWLRPAGSDSAFQATMYFEEDLVAGDYTFKITLQNGKYKTISFSVAEMGTPVAITVTPVAAVTELGSKTYANVKLVDANGVTCKATKKGTDISVNGYAVAKTEVVQDDSTIDIWTKADDKYLNSEIKIVAVNDRYNLTGEGTIKVTSGQTMLMPFVTEAKINTPTDLPYAVMDLGHQNILAITYGNNFDTMSQYWPFMKPEGGPDEYPAQPGDYKLDAGHTGFIVVAKPEGATVNFGARAAGGGPATLIQDVYGQSRIECDKPGVVTVKYTLGLQIYTTEGTWATRYYEGTANIVFSDGSIGKTVVMSIGSSEIVVDGNKAAIDAAPVVQNSRTYVPFRALAEAFGAEVAYDEATQAVTATLGSNTVVMTIGSAAYTVNGAEKTADVAPYISGGRTMVPVRFAAEAFGSTVIPTYDDNGATADVLFKL